MAFSKIIYKGNTMIDVTNTSVNPLVLANGYTAIGPDGQLVNGSLGSDVTGIQIDNKILTLSAGQSIIQTPYVFDLNMGYVNSVSTQFVYEYPTLCYNDIYTLEKSTLYWLGIGGTVGTRFRAVRVGSDPTVITSGNINGTAIIAKNSPSTYSNVMFTSGTENTQYLCIQKDNAGVSGLHTYLIKIGVSAALS